MERVCVRMQRPQSAGRAPVQCEVDEVQTMAYSAAVGQLISEYVPVRDTIMLQLGDPWG